MQDKTRQAELTAAVISDDILACEHVFLVFIRDTLMPGKRYNRDPISRYSTEVLFNGKETDHTPSDEDNFTSIQRNCGRYGNPELKR